METKTCMESMLKRIETLESIVLPQKPARFIDNGDGTITDAKTELMWQKETAGEHTWGQAMDYCQQLKLAGHEDWRLPNINELQSIVDYDRYSPAIDPVFMSKSSYYWSSTTSADDPSYAWGVLFLDGDVSNGHKTHDGYVRAVRAGQ